MKTLPLLLIIAIPVLLSVVLLYFIVWIVRENILQIMQPKDAPEYYYQLTSWGDD